MATLKKLTAIPKINFALHKHFEDDEGSRILDVVYIHGLDGDLWKTWAHDAKNTIDYFWPYWLQNDFNQVGVWSLGYDAPLAVFDYSQSLTLEDLAKELSNFLATTEIGKSERGVIFVSHSLGGMMVKKMLFEGMQLEEMRVKQMPVQESSSNPLEYMASRTRGVAFIAVPHFGLKFANSMQFVNRRLPLVYANKVFEDLKIGEENLAPLHAKFEEYADNKRIVRYLFWEGYLHGLE